MDTGIIIMMFMMIISIGLTIVKVPLLSIVVSLICVLIGSTMFIGETNMPFHPWIVVFFVIIEVCCLIISALEVK